MSIDLEKEAHKPRRMFDASLESEVKLLSFLLLVMMTGMFALLTYLADLSVKVALSIYLVLLLLSVIYLFGLYRRVVRPMNTLANIIEAIRLEDYRLSPKITYKSGVLAQVLGETVNLVEVLRQRKERYNQHVYLIYRLIEQLDLPVIVFDEKLRLSHGNDAFGKWYGQPWKVIKGISCKKLGFIKNGMGGWEFNNPDAHQGWQIRSSSIENANDIHQLLVLNDIKSEVRQVQQDAWQQIIRVLTHEIRNSLTPICSMTELMLDTPELDEKLRTPLQVIENRSTGLLQFVERYADIAKPIKIALKEIKCGDFIERLLPLFPDQTVQVEGGQFSFTADPILLEQVLINLIRNGLESQQSNNCDDLIIIEFLDAKKYTTIKVKDNGTGIINPDNLFVPFYTTKEGGQGIGLNLCRKIIEQHQGSLTLENNGDGGAIATINLPK